MAKHLKSTVQFSSRRSWNIALIALAFLVGIIIVGRLIHFLLYLNQPISPQLTNGELGTAGGKHFLWQGNTAINIAVKAENVAILNISPQQKKVTVLSIPNETYFELPKNYGSWPVGSIYKLGQEENPPVGAKLLKDSLTSLLGLPIDAIVVLPGENAKKDALAVIEDWQQQPIGAMLAMGNWQTDLTPWEGWQVVQQLSRTRADKTTKVDLAQSNITVSKLLPDSSRVLGVNQVRMDLYIRDKMFDQAIFQEGTTVAIYNATDHSGLAQEAARIWTNLGGNVIITASWENKEQLSKIILSPDSQDLKTADSYIRLSQIFAPWCLDQLCSDSSPKINNSRAQINVIVGEDWYQSIYQR